MTQKADRNGFEKLLAAQKKIGTTIKKSEINPHFKSGYVPLPMLLRVVVPCLQAEGLLLVQAQQDLGRDGVFGVVTQIIEASTGTVIVGSCMPMPLGDANPQKAIGSNTYGKRTGITSLLAIGEEDDDGNKASEAPKQKRAGAGAKTGSKSIFG